MQLSSTSWRNKFNKKSKPNIKNKLHSNNRNNEEADLTYKNDAEPEPNIESFLIPESNNKNNIECEQNFKNVMKQDVDDNNDLGLDVKNGLELETIANDDIKQGNYSDYSTDGDFLTGLTALWSYKDQDKWVKSFPDCELQSQSPVDLPSRGLVAARGARPLTFINYDTIPLQLRLKSDGRAVTLQGDWEEGKHPVIYGGAGHSRRYWFHSMTLHAPSEHTIEKLLFPLETQVLHVSTDYATLDDAVNGSTKDHLAFLAIGNIYKFGYKTEPALKQLLKIAGVVTPSTGELRVDNAPLSTFCPPFAQYACYHGSLTMPPCSESVLWLIRGRALPVEREVVSRLKMASGNRFAHPLNDRRVFLFDKK